MRSCVLIFVCGLALAPPASAGPQRAVDAVEPAARAPEARQAQPSADAERRLLLQALATGRALLRKRDHVGAGRTFDDILAHPLFGTLSAEERRAAWSGAAGADIEADRLDRARERTRRAIEADPGDADDWYRLSTLNYDLEDHDAAAAAFIELAQRWPELLVNVNQDYITWLLDRLERGSPRRVEYLQSLFDARWERPEYGSDRLWYQLALAHLENGDEDRARAVVRRIIAPELVVRMRSDRRFDSAIDRDGWTFDAGRSAERAIEAQRDRVAAQPRNLMARVQLTYRLLEAGQHAQTLRVADEALRAIAEAGVADEAPFDDIQQQIWLMNNRAIALRRLGRVDEALDELLRASRLVESGGGNVSQSLNLGMFMAQLGRADEARASIGRAPEQTMTGYGRMVRALVELRIALLREDRAAERRAFAYLRRHREDAPDAYLDALLLTGRIEDAAQALIARLASPEDRGDALFYLQEFRENAPLPGDAAHREHFRRMRDRDDLRAAVEAVGRIERHPVFALRGMQ